MRLLRSRCLKHEGRAPASMLVGLAWGTWVAVALGIACGRVDAAEVAMAGRLGSSVVLVVDGRTVTLAPGAQASGITLIRSTAEGAEVLVDGKRRWVGMGDGARGLGAPPAATATAVAAASAGWAPPARRGEAGDGRIVLPTAPDGHVYAEVRINGRPSRMMLDTGATLVAIGRGEAERLGLDLSHAPRAVSMTANGPTLGWRVVIPALQVQGVTLAHVDAVVLPIDMPIGLLGNSALSRFDLQRQGDTLRLARRP